MDNKRYKFGDKRPYRVYRNLHKNNFSVQTYLYFGVGWKVTDRISTALLEDVSFRVYENGRQKVISEKRKNVHAFVEPMYYTPVAMDGNLDLSVLREIYYNPYILDSFVYKDTGEKLVKVNKVLAHDNKLYDVSDIEIVK